MLNSKRGTWVVLAFLTMSGCLTQAQESFAGTQTGGGGGSIVCFYSPKTLARVRAQGGKLTFADLGMDEKGRELPGRGTVESIEAYDLFEAKLPHNLTPGASTAVVDLLPSETYDPTYEGKQDYAAYVERLAKRFDKTVLAAAELIRTAATYRESAIVQYPNGVAQVDDANPATDVPDVTRCALVTTALQHNEGRQLFIDFDRRLMTHSKNSQLSRAVLNLHEDLYALGRQSYNMDNSRPIRDLLNVILEQKIQQTQLQLLDYFRNLGLYTFDCGKSSIDYVTCKDQFYLPSVTAPLVTEILSKAEQELLKFDQDNAQVVTAVLSGKYPTMTVRQVAEWSNAYESSRVDLVLQKIRQTWSLKKAEIEGKGFLAFNDPQTAWATMMDAWVNSAHMVRTPAHSRPTDFPYSSSFSSHFNSGQYWLDQGFQDLLDHFTISSEPVNGTVTFPNIQFNLPGEQTSFPAKSQKSRGPVDSNAAVELFQVAADLPAVFDPPL